MRKLFDISTIKDYFRWFNFKGIAVKFSMSRIGRKHNEHVGSIVVFFSKMMNLLLGKKVSTNLLFYYKTMFSNIPLTITKWVFRFINKNISSANNFTSFPVGIFFTTKLRKFFALIPSLNSPFCSSAPGYQTFFKLSFRRPMLTLFCVCITIPRTIFNSLQRWNSCKFFSTIQATLDNMCFSQINTPRHISSKIKAAFGGLKETVKFPHLRRQILDTKKLFPSSAIIIAFLILMSSNSWAGETSIDGRTNDGHIIQDEGISLKQRPRLNFSGAGVSATTSGDTTVVTIPGGSGSLTFQDTATIDMHISGSEVSAEVIESGLEAILDLQDLQGAVTDAQVPNNITITEVDPTVDTSAEIMAIVGDGYVSAEVDPVFLAVSGDYVKLAGRSGGQTIKGGTGEGEDLSFWTNSTGTVGSYFFTDLTNNGFVKTSGGTGVLSIDTNTYLTAESDPTVDTSAEIMTILGNEAITLGTNTKGNYVATIADSGAGEVTVANSGTENAAVTLGLAAGITRDTEWDTSSELIAILGSAYLTTETDPVFLAASGNYVKTSDIFGGDASGTYNNIIISDDSHNHTTTTISGLDISSDTNLAGTANQITLTDDTLSLALNKDLVTTAPLTGGTDNILIGADSDVTIAIPAGTSTTDGYITSSDWVTFNGKMAGTLLGDIVATAPVLIDGTTNVNDILPGADVDRTISINLLKDLVTTSPLQGGTDNILPGTDSDVTLTLQVSGDIVATAPILIDSTTAVNDILVGGDIDRTISINMLGDLATTSPITGAVANIFPGANGNKATIGITLSKDLVTTFPLTGGTDNILPGTDSDVTISIPVATSTAAGYLASADWITFNGKEDETHAADHAVGATDTVFPADPNADKYLMWDDDPGALVWSAAAGGEATTVSDTTTLDLTLAGADIKGDVVVLKDLVTTAPLTGGTNDILVGTDSDITLAVQVSGDLVTTAPVTGGTNDIFPGADTDYTIALTQNLPGINKHLRFTIIDPATVYAKDTQVCLVPKLDAAITITNLECSFDHDLSTEATGDIKYADTFIGLANATVINDWDTTAGVRSDSTIASGSVAAGKCIYLQFDVSPEASATQMTVDLTYDYDS